MNRADQTAGLQGGQAGNQTQANDGTLKRARRGVSLRLRLLIFLISITLISLIMVAFLALDSVNQLGLQARQVSSDALTGQLRADLVQYNTLLSQQNDRFFAQIQAQTEILAHFAVSAYEHALTEGETLEGLPQEMTRLADGQYSGPADAVSSVYIPNFADMDAQVTLDVRAGKELDEIFPSIQHQFPEIVAVFYATPNQVTRYYPNVNLGAVLPADWRVTDRPWFAQAVSSGGRSAWVSPYEDATGRGLVATVAVPVYAGEMDPGCSDCPAPGTLLGVIGADVLLSELTQPISANNLLPNSSYSFLVDWEGRGINLSAKAYTDLTGNTNAPDPLVKLLPAMQSGVTPAFQPVISAMQAGQSDVVELSLPVSGTGVRQVFVAYSPLPTTGWSVGTVIDASQVLSPLDALQAALEKSLREIAFQRFLPAVLALVAVIVLLIFFLTERWLQPIRALAAAAAQIGAGRWDVALPETTEIDPGESGVDSGDELQILAHSFRLMKEQLYASLSGLEDRVRERTSQLERRQLELQAAADLARDITQTAPRQMVQFDALLGRAVELISQRFGFYFTGIYLLDDRGESVLLQAGSGAAGHKLVAEGHRLPVSDPSTRLPVEGGRSPAGIISTVARTGIARAAQDTTRDALHVKNPYLPETRSEAALPLKAAGAAEDSAVIGVLDVQSEALSAFGEQELAVLQILADQLAVAIQNARLFRFYQQNLQELESLYRQLSRDSWRGATESRQVVGFEMEGELLNPLVRANGHEVTSSADRKEAATEPYRLPVVVRGQTVARLQIWLEGGRMSQANRRLLDALADRLGQAFEAARLFDETQARSYREQAINQFAAELSNSADLQSLLKSAVRRLSGMPNVSEVTIEMDVTSTKEGQE